MAGNWKMYKTVSETVTYFEKFNGLVASARHCEIAICPTFVNLAAAVEATKGTNVGIGAQNLYWAKEGAFTGEISGEMLKAIGCQWVIVGHSERRQYFGDTDEKVNKRIYAALAHKLKVIMCVGETKEERLNNVTEEVIRAQVAGGLKGLTLEHMADFTIAYEPVWAIGTGLTATPTQAQEVHKYIRALVKERFNSAVAETVRIQYGGSVKPDNAKELLSQPDIDGALVGGASLVAADFEAIVKAAK